MTDVKRFSAALANAALPLVSRIAADLVQSQARLAELGAAYEVCKAEPEPSQVVLNETWREMAAVSARRDACVAELVELGLEVKDPATGLVDFPGELDGTRVLFCWRVGEARVEHFHGESEGFANRRPIAVPCQV